MKVLLYGTLADAIGKSEIIIENVDDVTALNLNLETNYPKLGRYKFVIAINKQIVMGNAKLNNEDIVALLPPFSGG